eukprot:3659518-Pyramimonas_sp.AAC.1
MTPERTQDYSDGTLTPELQRTFDGKDARSPLIWHGRPTRQLRLNLLIYPAPTRATELLTLEHP